MLNYTCIHCNKELRVEKNDIPLIHFINNDRKQGIDAIRFGDIWCCPKCNCKIMLGLGDQMNGNGTTGCEDFLKEYPYFIEVKR